LATAIPARLTPAEGRKFGLLVGGAFAVIGVLLWWRGGHVTAAAVVLAVASALIVGGLLVPGRMGPVYRGWMALALAISKVTTPLLMGVIYFLVITPSGILARLLGHRPITRARSAPSYWQTRPARTGRSSMTHQF
jgi:hypothetical protein